MSYFEMLSIVLIILGIELKIDEVKNWQKNIMYTKVISRNGEMLIWNMV